MSKRRPTSAYMAVRDGRTLTACGSQQTQRERAEGLEQGEAGRGRLWRMKLGGEKNSVTAAGKDVESGEEASSQALRAVPAVKRSCAPFGLLQDVPKRVAWGCPLAIAR
eukprot:1054045-Pleurochrysis_carterae.AAC.1